jgi:hypothetical protein
MKLPNAAQALVDLAKLRDYCLNPAHPRGRHKARVFATALGQRYVLDFPMNGPGGRAMVRSMWIVLSHENFARLTSCYVL